MVKTSCTVDHVDHQRKRKLARCTGTSGLCKHFVTYFARSIHSVIIIDENACTILRNVEYNFSIGARFSTKSILEMARADQSKNYYNLLANMVEL